MVDPYFIKLNSALKEYKRSLPFLLVDLDKLDANLKTLSSNLNPDTSFRIVVKSLPSYDLINYIRESSGTNKLMVFHQPFLTDLSSKLDRHADILLGKPMPIRTAKYFFDNIPSNDDFNAYTQIQWLVDSVQRIQEYIDLAKSLGQTLRLNLEIDVGLHRGGFSDQKQLVAGLALIKENQAHVTFSGLMGYDAHVTKLPKMIRSQQKALHLANSFYEACKATVRNDFPELWHDDLTFNGAGSPTINLHKKDSPLNDISAGSCLVKPTTFDIPTLEQYQAASYIAAPILKSFNDTTLPAIEGMKGTLSLLSAANKRSYFIYGGYWKAEYCYPVGLKRNSIFGDSTNQTMVNAPVGAQLEVDDFIFMRPHQSEFVFLQFGNILTVRDNKVEDEWNILKNY